jgi:FG-GAP-like repeat
MVSPEFRIPRIPGTNPFGVAVGDLNRDGLQDLAVANVASFTASVFFSQGNSGFRTRVDLATDQCPKSVAIGDLNGDGVLDLATPNECTDTVSVLFGSFSTAPLAASKQIPASGR